MSLVVSECFPPDSLVNRAIGFKQDYYASQKLEETSPAAYERYKAANENSFAGLTTVGLDGAKVGILADNGAELARADELLESQDRTDENHDKLEAWWNSVKADAEADKAVVDKAGLYGGRMALKITSFVPAIMAVFYIGLLIYFRAIGGYKALTVSGEEASGGVEGSGSLIAISQKYFTHRRILKRVRRSTFPLLHRACGG